MQICRNCDNLWWRPNMHSVTYTPRGQARAELRLCVYSIYVCVCAQRGRRVATSSSSMTILLQFRCLVLGAPQKKKKQLRGSGYDRGWGTAGRPAGYNCQHGQQATSVSVTVTPSLLSYFSLLPPFRYLFFFLLRLLRFFLMCCARSTFCGSLSCQGYDRGEERERERASAAGSGLRNGLQFYLGDVTNAISVSHMCKNVFRFMRAPTPTGCVSCPDVIRHTRTQS